MADLITESSVFYELFHRPVISSIGCDEYKDEFKQVLMAAEEKRKSFWHQSPQISFRKCLVRYIKAVCEAKSLSIACVHLAVYLLDIFMDNHQIVVRRLLLVANVSLSLAAKLEENANRVPKISELNSLVDHERYEIMDHITVEVLMLKYFRFHLKFPCAVHYVFYYTQEVISDDDLKDDQTFRSLFYDVYDGIRECLDRVLEDVHYLHYHKPSKLAAAVIAKARFENGLSAWCQKLEDLSGYKEEDFTDIMHSLITKTIILCPRCGFSIQNIAEKI